MPGDWRTGAKSMKTHEYKSWGVCKICGEDNYNIVYYGEVRGSPDSKKAILECSSCHVHYLDAPAEIDYKDKGRGYRGVVSGDEIKRHMGNINNFCPLNSLSGRRVVDIGASNGTYMRQINEFAKEVIGVEPNENQRNELSSQFEMFDCVVACVDKYKGKIDAVTCWHVIEHIEYPALFLKTLMALLNDYGRMYLSTPNRDEILMELLPDDYPKFFYQLWHPFYYNKESFVNLAHESNLIPIINGCGHSFGIGNMIGWLSDKKPCGEGIKLCENPTHYDELWKSYLMPIKKADTLYMLLRKEIENG